MFKFKMLTKVLVAVFFYGQIIELNLNLCIALSIDLSSPTHQIEPNKARSSPIEHNAELEMLGAELDEQLSAMSAAPFASRTLQSASASTSQTTITTTDNKSLSNLGDTPPEIQQATESQLANDDDSVQYMALVQRLQSNGRCNYFGELLVGQNQVPFMVLFDLTSTNFWLPSIDCKSNRCLSSQRYNRSESSTYRPDGANRRVKLDRDLVMEGSIVWDSITFAGITIEQQPFGEITKLEGDLLAHLPVDGFLGLGFKEFRLSSTDNGTTLANETPMTPIESLWSMGLLKEPIFSLKLKDDIVQFGSSPNNGELILGEISPEYSPNEFTYVPVTHVDYWEFHLSGVSLRTSQAARDMEQGCESVCPAILDTRYNFIAGHFSDVDRINRAMGAFPIGNGIYRMSQCDLGLLPDLVFKIGDQEFLLAPDEYVDVRKIRGSIHSCYSALVVVDAEVFPFWILGEYFLKRHYVVFDYGQKRIGFARSKTMTQELVDDEYGRVKKVRGPRMVIDVL